MRSMNRRPFSNPGLRFVRAVAVAAALTLTACGDQDNRYVPPPPPEVIVAHPTVKPVTDYLELTGSASAVASVNLVARVPGYLDSIGFTDGTVVNKGDLLFVIEQAPYQAKVDLAQATLEQQQAQLTRASEEYDRQVRLVKQSASSQADVEKWLAERNSASAAVDEAKANLEIANINLGYTKVSAPFSGRICRHLVDVGNLVGSPSPTDLATIEQVEPIYVYFNVDEPTVLRLRAKVRERGLGPADINKIRVDVGLQTDDGYPHEGHLDFVDTGIDPSTGTLQVRAVFPNSDKAILPGAFVRVRVPVGKQEHALLVSDRALGVDQAGSYLLVVDAKNVVQQRTVEIGALVDGMRVITKGLTESDWVVVEGLQKATPGAEVKVSHSGGGAESAAAASAGAASPKASAGQ